MKRLSAELASIESEIGFQFTVTETFFIYFAGRKNTHLTLTTKLRKPPKSKWRCPGGTDVRVVTPRLLLLGVCAW